MAITKCSNNKGFSDNSSILPCSNFGTGGQFFSPQALTASTLNWLPVFCNDLMYLNKKMMEEVNNLKIEILREKIKEMVDENPEYSGSQLYEAETMKLTQEITIQQIELEMQNKELKQASEQAIIAAREYAELYDFAPSGYFTLTPKGVIKKINIIGAKMLGKERTSLINSQFGFFVSDETRPAFNRFLSEIFIGKEKKTCEVALSDYGNMPIYVKLFGIVGSNGEQCFVTASDITDLKKDVRRIADQQRKYLTIIQSDYKTNIQK